MAAYLTGLGLAEGAEVGEGSEAPADTDPTGNEESPALSLQPPRDYTWGILGSGIGLVAGVGLAVWVKNEADERYDEYLITADPEHAQDLFDSAQRYDRATVIGWAMAQVSFVALVYFLTRDKDRPLVPVEGEPLVRPYRDGVELGFRFTP
jgi:hypothetical protein